MLPPAFHRPPILPESFRRIAGQSFAFLPLTTPQQLESDDSATVRRLIRDSLAEAKPRR